MTLQNRVMLYSSRKDPPWGPCAITGGSVKPFRYKQNIVLIKRLHFQGLSRRRSQRGILVDRFARVLTSVRQRHSRDDEFFIEISPNLIAGLRQSMYLNPSKIPDDVSEV